MNLKPSEKAAILAGKHPAIVRSKKGDKGAEIVLRSTRTPIGPVPQVVVTITSWRKLKHGGYKARYSIQDDRELFLNRGLGYTRSRSRALDTEAPVLDEETAAKFAMEGEQKSVIQSAERTAEQKREGKEARKGSSPRSERAIKRHAKAIEGRIRA